MGVDDPLGVPGSAGRKTHDRTVFLVDVGIAEVVGSTSEKVFIGLVALSRRNGIAGIPDDEDALKRGRGAKLLEDGEQTIIDEKEAIARGVGDGRDFVRMKAEIERVQD